MPHDRDVARLAVGIAVQHTILQLFAAKNVGYFEIHPLGGICTPILRVIGSASFSSFISFPTCPRSPREEDSIKVTRKNLLGSYYRADALMPLFMRFTQCVKT